VPVSEQLRWEDHSPDKINHWSLPSELLSLNVTDLPVANFIFLAWRSIPVHKDLADLQVYRHSKS
jgi:hypothetical protein